MASPVQKLRTFYEETMQEAKRCSWPSRQELYEQTAIVITTVVILTTFILLVDTGSQHLVNLIITR